LPRAPRDDASARSRRYLIMMAIRLVCFLLMVVITPYGWQTWVLGAAAIFLPYIAVVSANNGEPTTTVVENPERMIESAPPPAPADLRDPPPRVIRLSETPPATPEDPPAPNTKEPHA
jgi:hypothetical protein